MYGLDVHNGKGLYSQNVVSRNACLSWYWFRPWFIISKGEKIW